MARLDIHTNPVVGEVNTTKQLTNKAIYDFLFLEGFFHLESNVYCFGEVLVNQSFKVQEQQGIYIRIPYIAEYKKMKLRFRIDSNNPTSEYLINKKDNSIWFPIQLDAEKNIYVSELFSINELGIFYLIFRDDYLQLYSGNETDFVIKSASRQNEVFLLKAFAGNLYQHPTTGVGLIDFLHGNFENTGLASKLQQEFENDKMVIHNAYMDSKTGELYLDVQEKNG